MLYDPIDRLYQSLSEPFREMLKTAYREGLEAGKKQTTEEMQQHLAQIAYFATHPGEAFATRDNSSAERVSVSTTTAQQSSLSEDGVPLPTQRAPRGSVRPTLLRYLASTSDTKKPSEIATDTGINENSVRGTLNALRAEGLTDKSGDQWHLTSAGIQEGLLLTNKAVVRQAYGLADDEEEEDDESSQPTEGDHTSTSPDTALAANSGQSVFG